MSTYTPFTKTDKRFIEKRLNEVLEKLQDRAYDIQGELEVMELDEDGKNFRQDAVADIERYVSELRPLSNSLDTIVKTYKNAPPLPASIQLLKNKEHREMMRHIGEESAMDERIAAKMRANNPER